MKNIKQSAHISLVARKEAGKADFTVDVEAEEFDEVFCALQALIEEICSVTGLTVERVIALLAAQMLAGN